jgi:hypothetical protein
MLFTDQSGADFGANTSTKFTRLYNNQFFDYLSEQLPKDHTEMMKWCEVVFFNSPALVNGIKKLVSYPLTYRKYKTESETVRQNTEKLLDDLDIESHLIQTGLDYYVYGNAFRSIHHPFTRFLECKFCGTRVNVSKAKYSLKKGRFILEKCPNDKCSGRGRKGLAKVHDKYTYDTKGLKLVSWDPKLIHLLSNPVTSDATYYYALPASLRKGLLNGEGVMAENLPEVFLDAFAQDKKVRFTQNFYHLRTASVAGYSSGWGVSPLTPTLKLFLYNAILRKSVEAIGLEHITPQRILFPQGTSSDPTTSAHMGKWREQVKKAIERWRMDPNYVMLAPFPTGVANIGSQGRSFMPTAEIKQTDQDMLLALDVPLDFVYGGLKMESGSVSLRVLENQLRPYVTQLTRYVNWIIDNVNAKYEKNLCHIEYGDFTLADDVMKRQMLVSMAGQGAAMSTVQEALGLDPHEERKKLKDDSIKDFAQQKAVEKAIEEIETNVMARAAERNRAEQDNTVPQYDQQKLVAAAQMKAQEILGVPYEERRSLLAQLSNEDYVMYALVSAQMDSMRRTLEKGE